MIIFILLIALTNSIVFSAEYFAYPKTAIEIAFLKKEMNAKAIFSTKEKTFLKDEDLKFAFKFNAKEDEIKYARNQCKTCKIELSSNAHTFNTYSHHQWSLNNTGKSFKRWISDIDVRYIKAKRYEDINIQGIAENPGRKIRVAIVDSGIDLNHPDLQGQFYQDAKECEDLKEYNECLRTNNNKSLCHRKFSNIDNNNNGYPLDCNGWNITGSSNPYSDITGNANIIDSSGHGTHIAGIIGAKDNNIGIKGIINNVELLPVKVGTTSQNNGSELPTDNIAKGILYAIKNKSHIINLSLGWRINQDSLLMRKMIKMAIDKDILIVAAAGNDSHDETVYPCSYQGVICVASHDVNGELSDFSNFGAHIDIIAPGTSILSTYPTTKRSKAFTEDSNYEFLSGTSQAAPHVTGILARLLNLGYTSKTATAKLLNGARKKLNSHKWIRNGNVNFKGSLKGKEHISFIATKSPALINISKNKEFKFKVNIFEKTEISISAKGLSFSKNLWHLNSKESDIELTSTITNRELNKKSYFLNVHFKSQNFNKRFTLQVNPIMIISDKNESKHLAFDNLKYKRAFVPDTIRAFDNFFDDTTDYIAIKNINNRYLAQGIIKKSNSYNSTKPIIISTKKSIVINISKVDINLNGKPNYVITAVDLSTAKRKTFFKILDHNFSLINYQVSPKNEYFNLITTLPGTFYWSKSDNKLLPTWIGFGKNPSYKQLSPWESQTDETQMYRLYQLHPTKGLTIKELDKDSYPVGFLYPSTEDRKSGLLHFITTNSITYKKDYNLYKLVDDKISLHSKIKTDFYFDILNMLSLPLAKSNKTNAYFYKNSTQGSQKILALEVSGDKLKYKVSTLKPKKLEDPILRVLRFDMKGNAITQTSNKLLVHTKDRIMAQQSYTNAKRIKHYLLKESMGVILSQRETFNLSSHTILISSNEEILEPAHLQAFGAQGCKEIGIESLKTSEYLSYFCEELKRIYKLRVSI